MSLNDGQTGAINGMRSNTVRQYTKDVQQRLLVEKTRDQVLAANVTPQAAGLHDPENGVTPGRGEVLLLCF